MQENRSSEVQEWLLKKTKIKAKNYCVPQSNIFSLAFLKQLLKYNDKEL